MTLSKTMTGVGGRMGCIRVGQVETRGITPCMVVAACLFCVILVLAFSFLNSAYEEARGQYMELLKKENGVAETNSALKMELVAISQKGYVEFVAQGRLGLKRPADEEVVVLR